MDRTMNYDCPDSSPGSAGSVTPDNDLSLYLALLRYRKKLRGEQVTPNRVRSPDEFNETDGDEDYEGGESDECVEEEDYEEEDVYEGVDAQAPVGPSASWPQMPCPQDVSWLRRRRSLGNAALGNYQMPPNATYNTCPTTGGAGGGTRTISSSPYSSIGTSQEGTFNAPEDSSWWTAGPYASYDPYDIPFGPHSPLASVSQSYFQLGPLTSTLTDNLATPPRFNMSRRRSPIAASTPNRLFGSTYTSAAPPNATYMAGTPAANATYATCPPATPYGGAPQVGGNATYFATPQAAPNATYATCPPSGANATYATPQVGGNATYVTCPPTAGANATYVSTPQANATYVTCPPSGANATYVSTPQGAPNATYVTCPPSGANVTYVATPQGAPNATFVSCPPSGANATYVATPQAAPNATYVSCPPSGANATYVTCPPSGANATYVSHPPSAANATYAATPQTDPSGTFISRPQSAASGTFVASPKMASNATYAARPQSAPSGTFVASHQVSQDATFDTCPPAGDATQTIQSDTYSSLDTTEEGTFNAPEDSSWWTAGPYASYDPYDIPFGPLSPLQSVSASYFNLGPLTSTLEGGLYSPPPFNMSRRRSPIPGECPESGADATFNVPANATYAAGPGANATYAAGPGANATYAAGPGANATYAAGPGANATYAAGPGANATYAARPGANATYAVGADVNATYEIPPGATFSRGIPPCPPNATFLPEPGASGAISAAISQAMQSMNANSAASSIPGRRPCGCPLTPH